MGISINNSLKASLLSLRNNFRFVQYLFENNSHGHEKIHCYLN